MKQRLPASHLRRRPVGCSDLRW